MPEKRDPQELTWSIDNRRHIRVHEAGGHRRIAPRTSDEATRFVASGDLLAACENLLEKCGHTLYAKHVFRDEFAAIRKAVAKAKGEKA